MNRKLEHLTTTIATATVIACTALVVGRRSHELGVPSLVGNDGVPAGARSSAVVVFRPADCESRLDFLALFDRPEIADHVVARRLLLLGDAADRERAQRALGTRARGVPIALADPRLELALRRLGARSTPLVIVFDTAGALRFFSPGPRSAQEYARLARTLSVLDVAG